MAKCLIVDDVDVTKFSTGLILKDMGVESDVAGNVQEAISALGSNTYDVVILDWCIGKDSGIDLLKRMRLDLGVLLDEACRTTGVVLGEDERKAHSALIRARCSSTDSLR